MVRSHLLFSMCSGEHTQFKLQVPYDVHFCVLANQLVILLAFLTIADDGCDNRGLPTRKTLNSSMWQYSNRACHCTCVQLGYTFFVWMSSRFSSFKFIYEYLKIIFWFFSATICKLCMSSSVDSIL